MAELRPTVSVGIPTYNQPEFLRQAVTSVLEQSWQDFEIVIVDDCSTDHTAEVVREFRDSRIRYHRTVQNLRPPASWNECARLARGEFFALLPHDDVYFPEFLDTMVTELRRLPDVGFSQCGYLAVDKDLCLLEVRKAAEESVVLSGESAVIWQTHSFYCNPAAILFRRSAIEELGLWDTHYWDDVVLILRTAFRRGFVYMPKLLCCVRVHGANLSAILVHEKRDLVQDVIDQQTALFAGILPMTEALLALRKRMSRELSYSCVFHALRAVGGLRWQQARKYWRRANTLHCFPWLDPRILIHVYFAVARRAANSISRPGAKREPVIVLGGRRGSGERLSMRSLERGVE